MNTVDVILNTYSAKFGPKGKIVESIKIHKEFPVLIAIMILEAIFTTYFLYQNKILLSLILYLIFLITVFGGSFRHSRKIKKRYGSLKGFEKSRINEFVKNVKVESDIYLDNMDENNIIEELIIERMTEINQKNKAKKKLNIGLVTTFVPFLIPIYINNINNIELITLSVMGIGFIIIFSSFKNVLSEYTTINKLEHISQILKELKLSHYKSNRCSQSSIYLINNDEFKIMAYRNGVLRRNLEIKSLWNAKFNRNTD